MGKKTLADKICIRCNGKAQYTLQVYKGEPLRATIAEEDCPLCLLCRIALHLWVENKTKYSEDGL